MYALNRKLTRGTSAASLHATRLNCSVPKGTVEELYIVDPAIAYTRWFLIAHWTGPSCKRGGWQSRPDPVLGLVVVLCLQRAGSSGGWLRSVWAALLSNHPDTALTGLTAMVRVVGREIVHVTRPTLAFHLFPLRIITFYWFSWSAWIPVTFQPFWYCLSKYRRATADMLPSLIHWIMDNVGQCRTYNSKDAADDQYRNLIKSTSCVQSVWK